MDPLRTRKYKLYLRLVKGISPLINVPLANLYAVVSLDLLQVLMGRVEENLSFLICANLVSTCPNCDSSIQRPIIMIYLIAVLSMLFTVSAFQPR